MRYLPMLPLFSRKAEDSCQIRGFIGDAHVTHAREEGSEVWHLCDKAVEAGAKVKIVADAGPAWTTHSSTAENIYFPAWQVSCSEPRT